MYLKKKEVAELLGININTLNVYMKKGLPYYRLGDGIIRIKESDLIEWLEKNKVENSSCP